VPVTGFGEGHLHTSRGIAEGCGALVKISAKTNRSIIELNDYLSYYKRDNCSTSSFRGKSENTYREGCCGDSSVGVDADTHWYEFEISAKSIWEGSTGGAG